MKTFHIKWANGSEKIDAETLEKACGKIRTRPKDILTGWLVRVKTYPIPDTPRNRKEVKIAWGYWDAEMFWKNLKGKEASA